MMTFCKKSVHSFLGLSNPCMPHPLDHQNLQPHSLPASSCNKGLGLITSKGDDVHRPPNVIGSATVVKPSPSSPPPGQKDPGEIGFIDDVGGGVDGLMSCTESLGFESCDERRVDDDHQSNISDGGSWFCSTTKRSDDYDCNNDKVVMKWRNKVGDRRRELKMKKFPPPLSSLNQNGQPSFFLRPVRKDGRLELTEVRIDRPEILRASREDGRLRLHLVRDIINHNDDQELDVINEDETEEMGEVQKIEEEEEEIEENKEEESSILEKQEERSFGVNGEGFRRCHELVNHHHHHDSNLHMWRQHWVTTR